MTREKRINNAVADYKMSRGASDLNVLVKLKMSMEQIEIFHDGTKGRGRSIIV